MSLLDGVVDRYGGVTLTVPSDMAETVFQESLLFSLLEWRKNGRRGIWITVGPKQSHLIGFLISKNFQMHHVNEKDASLTLTTWLEESISQLPRFCTHQVGVGGMVIHPDGKRILCISEKYESQIRWKLPGGLVDPGELLGEAVKREVKEETGVDVKSIRYLLIARERTDAIFNSSDLYFVFVADAEIDGCHLSPDSREVSHCSWMTPSEVLEKPENLYPLNRGIFEAADKILRGENGEAVMSGVTFMGFQNLPHVVYSNYPELTNHVAKI